MPAERASKVVYEDARVGSENGRCVENVRLKSHFWVARELFSCPFFMYGPFNFCERNQIGADSDEAHALK